MHVIVKMHIHLLAIVCLLITVRELYAYKNYTVETSDICSEITKRTISLGNGHLSGLLVGQKRLSDHRLDWNKDWKCSFEVKSKSKLGIFLAYGTGLFAVIQSMNLRMDPQTFECIDYIQFKSSDGLTSKKFCGQLEAAVAMDSKKHSGSTYDEDDTSEEDFYHRGDITLNSFIDFTAQLSVYIVINRKALQAGEVTDFQLAFTTFKHCHDTGYMKCDNDASKCISPEFFNDGIINCPNFDCVDEYGCKSPHPEPAKPLSVGTHILIGSGTGLVITFGIFICCIYACRKYGKLCWSDEFARPPMIIDSAGHTQTHVLPGNYLAEPDVHPVESAILTSPSAPPLGSDKDLPPPYESLFPDANVR